MPKAIITSIVAMYLLIGATLALTGAIENSELEASAEGANEPGWGRESLVEKLSEENESLTVKVRALEKENTLMKELEEENVYLCAEVNDLYAALQGAISEDSGCWNYSEGVATAYSPKDNQNGIQADENPNSTSIGLVPGDGIIAVDPERIPYNSKIFIIYTDGTVYKGIAGDTGGGMRNDPRLHVDIYKDTFDEAIQHGKQEVIIIWQEAETTQ